MTYQGSKAKYTKYIAPILQKVINENNITTFVDCCCGGCNIIKDIKAENRIGIDKNENLIAFLKTLADGTFQFPETMPTREDWDRCKIGVEEVDPAFKGFVGIFCSYNAGGFYMAGYTTGATGEKQYRGRCNTLKKEIGKYKDINFIADDYHCLENYKNCVIYIDPPYVNGRHLYDADKTFSHTEFWESVRKVSKDNYVFVSEQEAPEDFEVVWELVAPKNCFGKVTMSVERLFKYKGDDDNG